MKAKAKRPKPVSYRDVSRIACVCRDDSGKNELTTIIHDGMVKDDVGIGWVTVRKATAEDYLKYPEVK